jgi:hypothetical protein
VWGLSPQYGLLGGVEGERHSVTMFKNMPFADPVARFQPAVVWSSPAWEGVRDASASGPPCYQLTWDRKAVRGPHQQPQRERGESGAGGLSREVEVPLPSNSPHDHMILRVDLVGSHGRWKRTCLQTAHMTI